MKEMIEMIEMMQMMQIMQITQLVQFPFSGVILLLKLRFLAHFLSSFAICGNLAQIMRQMDAVPLSWRALRPIRPKTRNVWVFPS
jgi:hypothetical protein